MTNGEEPINGYLSTVEVVNKYGQHSQIDGLCGGLTKREYFAAINNSITWDNAAVNCDAKLGRTSKIEEVAKYLAEMKVIAADALINALNQKP